MLKKVVIVSILLAIGVFSLAYPRVYVVRDLAGGSLYWNADEALLFIGVGSSGAHLNYVRYAFEPFLVSWGDVRSPDDQRVSQILVIQITDKNVERYVMYPGQYGADEGCFGTHYVLFKNQIYTGCPARLKLWRWSGTRFELATPEELHGFDPMKEAQLGSEFDNVQGWSLRGSALGHVKYSLTLNGQPITYVCSGRTSPIGEISVDVIRPEQTPQRIWSLDEQARKVSKAEYEKIFRNP